MRTPDLNPLAVAMVLCDSATVSEAAKRLGVSRATLYKYQQSEPVKELVTSISAASVMKLSAALAIKCESYARVLEGILEDETAPVRDRIEAAKTLFTQTENALDRADTNSRLQAIEKALQGFQGGYKA